jgi:hypothetical protein
MGGNFGFRGPIGSSFSDDKDHLFMHLIESAPFSKGKNKIYVGVAGNLVAF